MALKNKKSKTVVKLTRKEQRKIKRNEKKIKRNEFYTKRQKPGKFVLNPDRSKSNVDEKKTVKKPEDDTSMKISTNKVPTTEELRKKDQKEQKKIEREMIKQRKKQLIEANIEEDRVIKQMEKQLGLNKRKSKTLPKFFSEDGLDYLLEVCDPERMKTAVAAEQELKDVNDEFEEDFALMSGKIPKRPSASDNLESEDSSDDNFEQGDPDEDNSDSALNIDVDKNKSDDENDSNSSELDEEDHSSAEYENGLDLYSRSENVLNKAKPTERKQSKIKQKCKSPDSKDHKLETPQTISSKKRKSKEPSIHSKKQKIPETLSDSEIEMATENIDLESDAASCSDNEELKGLVKRYSDGTWEDIYGRIRAKDGTVITKKIEESKYLPPAMRGNNTNNGPDDKKRLEKLTRLRRQLKGLLNRLAESNMHSIATQIEELYMSNSRNDMNDTLTNLMMDSLVSEVVTPERLLIEHVMLLTVLHANIGTEVGAHFLQHVIKKFNEYLLEKHEVENKLLDNIVSIIAQLYNFKMFESKLIYEILQKLCEGFQEKDVECILSILRSVGFSLRKDDPLALKNLILDLQKRAAGVSDEERDNSRVKFMLDILLAIKNNNVTKIPNYDISYSEHLKKLMKGFIRKGNYVTQLNISLEDLLKADERGRWWVVGSAWTGGDQVADEKSQSLHKPEGYSAKLLELAKKQRMNTDTRRNIFCIIMSAEDYLDAFEKIWRLGLKNQQDREIINVILHCCLQEKSYNPYYAFLAQKFCDHDRKYQMIIKYSVWDKLKSLSEQPGLQISNLAKLLIHLFIEKGLPISTLKIVQFSELDKITLRFMRQILIGILLHKDADASMAVFAKVSHSDKLKLFRESLRLFIHHFLLRNLKSEVIPEEQKILLETRAKMVERVLISKFRLS